MIDDFLNASHARFHKKFNEEWATAADADSALLRALTKDETFEFAYLLYAYSSHVQDELNMQKIALDWCNDKLDKMVAKNYHQFDSYMKYETKRNIKFMDILLKNKIVFKNGKDLAVHLNKLENNIQGWWQQKKIQKSVYLFLKNTNIYDSNPTSKWAETLKKFIS